MICNFHGLVDAAAPDGPGVDFHQPDDIRLRGPYECGDLRQYALVPEDIAGTR
jgi:hypothetical protein